MKSNKGELIMEKKIKVLAYCDSPTCATGFGTVSRNIFEALYRTGRYEIDILGINYWGDPHEFPYRIWPVGTNPDRDPYGRKKVANMIAQMDYDILFLMQDSFILDFMPEVIPYIKQNKKQHRSICYFPIDGRPKESWIRNISYADKIYTYTEYGKNQVEEVFPSISEVGVVPHGANVSDYFVEDTDKVKEFKKMFFGSLADKFIFMNVNRNQQRKDIPRTIQAFTEFRKHVKDSILYLHMAKKDQGWDLEEVCKSFGLSTKEDVIFPERFGPNQGYPREVLNLLYNSADCLVSTALGEGWGLSWVEAMATKTPVIMPNNTALTENIGSDRGWLSDSGTDPSLFTVLPNDNEVIRPLVDVKSLVKNMLEVYNNKEEVKRRTENAYKWVHTTLDWQGPVAKTWVSVFDEAHNGLKNPNKDVVRVSSNTINTETF